MDYVNICTEFYHIFPHERPYMDIHHEGGYRRVLSYKNLVDKICIILVYDLNVQHYDCMRNFHHLYSNLLGKICIKLLQSKPHDVGVADVEHRVRELAFLRHMDHQVMRDHVF